VFHSRQLFHHTLLPILAVPIPALSELCGFRLLPPGSWGLCDELPPSILCSGATPRDCSTLSMSLPAPIPIQYSGGYKSRNFENHRQQYGRESTSALFPSASGAKGEQTRTFVFNTLQMPVFSTPFESYSCKFGGRGFLLRAPDCLRLLTTHYPTTHHSR
jgi:hypothetical protein